MFYLLIEMGERNSTVLSHFYRILRTDKMPISKTKATKSDGFRVLMTQI